MPGDAVARDGEDLHFRYTARNVAPLQPEPPQPNEGELMPWVQVGTGAGQRDLVRSIADWALLRSPLGSGTLEMARRSARPSAIETEQGIYATEAQAARGRSARAGF